MDHKPIAGEESKNLEEKRLLEELKCRSMKQTNK